MANKKIVDVDMLSSLADNDSLFVNSNGSVKQVAVEDAGLTRMELLWENASPTSAFGPQTINLNLSEYSKIKIEFNSDITSDAKDIQTIINPVVVGKGGVAIRFGGVQDKYLGNVHFRYYQTISSSITFYDSYYQSWTGTATTLNNGFIVPYRIYGIKDVQ